MKKEKQNLRLFFAIDLPQSLKAKLIDIQDNFVELDARAVPPANFHITLSFLGGCTDSQLENIIEQLQPIKLEPFKIYLAESVLWPKQGIFAIGIKDEKRQLTELKKTIEKQLRNIDRFKIEKREFIPHITLYRGVEQIPSEITDLSDEIEIDHFNLMISESGKKGVYYRTIDSWPLTGMSVKQRLTGKG